MKVTRADEKRARRYFEEQTRVLAELAEALKADPTTRYRWDRVRLRHGDWKCRTVGDPQPPGLAADMVRVEVGLLVRGNMAHNLTTLTFDYSEDDISDIPQRVTDGVRAYIEEETA